MRHLSKLTALTLTAFVLLPGLRSIAAEPSDVESFVREYVATHMEDAHVPGLVVVYTGPQGAHYSDAFGFADLGAERPMTLDTPLRVGSLSKPVTAALALELEVKGSVDLDVPVDTYLDRSLADRFGEASTIRNLLQHLGGYPDTIVGSHHLDRADALSLNEWVDTLGERSTAPNVVASYSSVGYTLAGAAMEQAVGLDFDDVARDVIFGPLGMTDATFSQDVPSGVAVGYSWNGDFNSYPIDSPDLVPGAGLVASATDIGRFMTALLDGDGALHVSTRNGLLDRVGPTPGLRGYTTGLTEWNYDQRTVLYHEGNGIGTTNRMIILPDEGVGFFTSVNAEAMVGQGDPSIQLEFMRELHEQLIDRFFPGPDSQDHGKHSEKGGIATDDVGGTYISTRVDTGSPMRLEALVNQFSATAMGGGVGFGSSQYERVETGEYRSDSSGVSFRLADDGLVYATRGGTGSYRQAAGWELMTPNAVFLGGTLIVLVLASIAGARSTKGHLRLLMVAATALAVGFVGVLGYGLVTIKVMDLFTGLPVSIVVAQLLVAASLVAGVAVVSSSVAAYRVGGLTRRALMWSLVIGTGTLGLFGWAWMWSVLPI